MARILSHHHGRQTVRFLVTLRRQDKRTDICFSLDLEYKTTSLFLTSLCSYSILTIRTKIWMTRLHHCVLQEIRPRTWYSKHLFSSSPSACFSPHISLTFVQTLYINMIHMELKRKFMHVCCVCTEVHRMGTFLWFQSHSWQCFLSTVCRSSPPSVQALLQPVRTGPSAELELEWSTIH